MASYFRTAPQLVAAGTQTGNAGTLSFNLYTVPTNTVALVEMFRFRHSAGFADGYKFAAAITTSGSITTHAATLGYPISFSVADARPLVDLYSKSNTGVLFSNNVQPVISSFFSAGDQAKGLMIRHSGAGTITVSFDYRVWLFGG